MANWPQTRKPAHAVPIGMHHTRGSKMGMRPSSGACGPVIRLLRLWVRLVGLWAYAKRNFPGRASCGPFSKTLM